MTIHHATIKRAEKNGIILTEIETDEGIMAQALWAENNQRHVSKDPKIALNMALLNKQFVADWPNLEVLEIEGKIVCRSRDEEIEVTWTDEVPELGEVLDACEAAEVDPEEGYEEQQARHVIVADHYRAEYAERGNADHCGNWLAKTLEGRFNNLEGKFDIDQFVNFLADNEISVDGKWGAMLDSQTRGWQGRFRMGAHQKLNMVLARKGYLWFDNQSVREDAPREYLEMLLDKHPKIKPEWQ